MMERTEGSNMNMMASTTTTVTTSGVSVEDMEFLGNGSMMGLAMKMGDLDQVLDEISKIDSDKSGQKPDYSKNAKKDSSTGVGGDNTDTTEPNGSKSTKGHANLSHDDVPYRSFDDSSQFSDRDDDDDDDGIVDDSEPGAAMGLAQMKAELEQAELSSIARRGGYLEKEKEENEEETLASSTDSVTNKKQMVTAVAVKPSKECPLGISMKTSKGITTIVGIQEDGLLRNSELKAGMKLVMVNGVPTKNAKHARHLIQCSVERVKLVAVVDDE
jgi:hypothetical protein